jgi:predicted PhzF superfamily epimerase YddE/YHI9
VDYVCRYFVPAAGIDEDPVTGSVNCALAVYWAERLGKRSMTVYQASARGGRMRVELDGERVRLTGHAVTTLRGTLYG